MDEERQARQITFSRGYDVCIMAIDGTWRRDCQLKAVSDAGAIQTLEQSIQGLNLDEFFLLLSSTGLAYRKCDLVRVNGTEIEIRFLWKDVNGFSQNEAFGHEELICDPVSGRLALRRQDKRAKGMA